MGVTLVCPAEGKQTHSLILAYGLNILTAIKPSQLIFYPR